MILPTEKGKRLRTRAPLSCLNCKRRKVKCDKGRPCAGCVRNNVGHLCVYVDPKWAEPLQAIAGATLGQTLTQNLTQTPDLLLSPVALPATGSPQLDIAKGSAEYVEMQRKVEAQAKEIMCLRARLKMLEALPAMQTLQELKTSHGAGPESKNIEPASDVTDRVPLSVLAKLSGSSGGRSIKPAVLYDNLYTMAGLRAPLPVQKSASTPSITTLYSWLNIVKIDPQLTSLWFRITNLQKSYHIYKTSLLKLRPRPGLAQVLDMCHSQSTMSNDSSCGHHKCPVVACEFNLMLEESEGDETEETGYTVKAENALVSPETARMGSVSDSRGEDALGLLTRLQGLWSEILSAARNTETLDFQQLVYLVNFYTDARHGVSSVDLGNPKNSTGPHTAPGTPDIESRELLGFFKQEILGLFSQKGASTETRLDVGIFSPKMSDAEVMSSLKTKAVYMAMLAIIVEESIDHLRLQAETSDKNVAGFRLHFPLEKMHAGTGHKQSAVLSHMVDLMQDLFDPAGSVHELGNLMAVISLMVSYLNRIGLLYERKDISVDVRDLFTKVFTMLLETLIKDGTVLQIWCDPSQVTLQGSGASASQRDTIGVFFCRLWNDFLRLANNATFHLLPYLRHSAHVDKLLETILGKVPQIETANTHVTYLKRRQPQNSPESFISTLIMSLRMQHLIARASVTLRNGIIGNSWEGGVAVCDLFGIANEMSCWSETQALAGLGAIRSFEVKVIFHYLNYLFLTIVFLQHEDANDQNAISQLIPVLFQRILALNQFLQSSTVQCAKYANALYVWSAVAETLARVSHLVSGLLIRFKSEAKLRTGSKSPETSESPQSLELLVYTSRSGDVKIPVLKKEEVIREADKTVDLLQSAMGREASRNRTKIWKFYQTFIRNSHKQNPVSYANIHADAFGSGRLLNNCPIMASSSYEVSATRMELSKCPVFHSGALNISEKVTTPRSTIPSKCPIAGITSVSDASLGMANSPITDLIAQNVKAETPSGHPASAKEGLRPFTPQSQVGKCPFGHDAIGAQTPQSGTPVTGNADKDLRKRKREYSQDIAAGREPRGDNQTLLFGRLTKFTPPLCVPSASPLPPPPLVPQPPPVMSAFTNPEEPFGDMDWDSLPNFNFDLMEDEALMGQINGGDFNNPVMEGLFQ